MNNKLMLGCGRSISWINFLEMVRAFVNGDPVTDVDLMKIYRPKVGILWKIILQSTEEFTLVTKYHLSSLAAKAVPLKIMLNK